MKITNNSPAPQGVHSVSGLVYVMPGESAEVELTELGHKGASRLSFLDLSGEAPKSLAKTDDEEKQRLLEQLKALGINANGNSKVDTLQAKLDEALADKAKAEQARKELEQALTEKGIAFAPSQTDDELRALLPAAE